MNAAPERIGPVARMEDRAPFPDALRHQFAGATPEEIEFAIQRLPPQAIETFQRLRRLKDEILAWRRRMSMRLYAS